VHGHVRREAGREPCDRGLELAGRGAGRGKRLGEERGEAVEGEALLLAGPRQVPGGEDQQAEEDQHADAGRVDLQVEAAHQPGASASWLRAKT
jgi:hypothetical protein